MLYYAALTLVILIHVYIVVLEMVLWERRGPKVFGITPEFAKQTKALASNQGLYNGFLVIALVVGLALEIYGLQETESAGENFAWRMPLATAGTVMQIYGLGCVVLAGIWGAITSSPRILLVQTVPAVVALALLYFR